MCVHVCVHVCVRACVCVCLCIQLLFSIISCIYTCPHTGNCSSSDNDEDDDFSTGAAVAITAVVTFVITLVVTVVITYIITNLYYQHQIKKIASENTNTQDNSQFMLMDWGIKMDNNPVMDRDAIKIDTNPAYAVSKWLKYHVCYSYTTVRVWYHMSTRGITGLYHAKETEINTFFQVPASFYKTKSIYSIRAVGGSIQLTVLLEYIDLHYSNKLICAPRSHSHFVSLYQVLN